MLYGVGNVNRIAELRAYLTATDASVPARLVFTALSVHANGEPPSARLSMPTLARETGSSRSTVWRALRELEQRGDIVGEYIEGTATRFTLTWASGYDPYQPDTSTGVTVTPPPVSNGAPTGVKQAQNPCHSDTHNELNVTTTRDDDPDPERDRREIELIEIRAQRAAIVGGARAQHHRERKGRP